MSEGCIRIDREDQAGFGYGAADTVLTAALRASVALPYECNSGGCGVCQFELVNGDVTDRWPQALGISDRQRARGRRLACQSVPQGDCTIRVKLDDSGVVGPLPSRREVRLVQRRQLTSDMAEFVFAGEDPADFLPGQYAMLSLSGVEGLRAYSMSNIANTSGEWRFVIKRVRDGAGTTWLFDLAQTGDAIMLDGPFGKSFLRTDNHRPVVCIAGGSGLSPVLSILRGIAASPEMAGRQVLLFHGIRGPHDACTAAELASINGLTGQVQLIAAISDSEAPDADKWEGPRGLIHDVVRERVGSAAADYEYYFCGPPPMTDAVHRLLMLEAKVPAAQIHFDRFY